jgi:putative oxidoreductase
MLSFLNRFQPVALTVLRIVLGVIMFAHGYQKVVVQGGMQHHVQSVQSLGLPGWSAYLSGAAEFGGGMLLILGALTRFAALAVCINLLVAIAKVHWKNGFLGQGNYQFPLALAVIAFYLIFSGAGPISVDRLVGGKGKT